MIVRFAQPGEVPLEPVAALVPLDLRLHAREVRRQLEFVAVGEPDRVVCRAAQELDAFGLKGGIEVREGLVEELGQEQK